MTTEEAPRRPRRLSGPQLFVLLLPGVAAMVVVVWLFWTILPGAAVKGAEWRTLAKLAAALALAFGTAALLRYALAPLSAAFARSGSDQPPPPPPPVDPDANLRTRIAPLVLAVGSAAIVALALGLVAAFLDYARAHPNGAVATKLDTLLMGVFTAVLPVFATWVGTVLAFYFTNESFRQAAQSAREAEAARRPANPVLARDRMIPYDRIVKVETARATARGFKMSDIVSRFSEQVTRVIIFDEQKQPIFIVRSYTPPMPKAWADALAQKQPLPGDPTVDAYLKQNNEANALDARRFGFVARTATLAEAREALAKAGDDLFVTETGQPTEPVLGWLPRDRLAEERPR